MIDVELWSLNKTIISNKEWQQIRESVRREFAFEAIFGQVVTNAIGALAKFNIRLLPAVAIIIQADTEGMACFDEVIIKMRQKDMYNRVIAMFEQDVEGIITVVGRENIFAIPAGERNIVLLLPVDLRENPKAAKDMAKNYGRHIKAHILKNADYSISLGIGRSYSFENMRQSYSEACIALKHKFYQGNGAVIHYSDIFRDDWVSQRIFIEYETKMLNIVRKGDWQLTPAIIAELLGTIGAGKSVDPDVLKVRVLELITVVSRSVMELGGDPDVLLGIRGRAGQEIVSMTTLTELAAWLPGVIAEMYSLLQQKQQAAIVRAVSHAKHFIAENYQQDISLEDMAKRHYLSTCYFSRAFTEIAGTGFTDYLRSVRIKQAQALLLSTDKGVGEIASKVGYQDQNYFSRVFKTMIGKSPQQYRQGTGVVQRVNDKACLKI